ncbi:hypothetical protein DQQ10_18785 [Pseudochryseolinea flava]|uniref:Uncharacterized protein n=1 Tax=Pseudochryseolinea flava TaxID=2059302 RepID=A0A364Y0N1_9BACT|nr:hypothetical protein DQQ10_18785 [Pseudochryseolinea flava]
MTARQHLKDQSNGWIENCLRKDLEPLDPVHTFNAVHKIVRSIEEFINISMHEVDLEQFNTLRVMPILRWNSYYNNLLDNMLRPRFEKVVVDRYKRVVLESHQMLVEFSMTGDNLGYSTVMEAAIFYQAFRRHFINTFLIVPTYCKGGVKLSESELLRVLVNISNFCLINVTALQTQLLLSHVYKDYQIDIYQNGAIVGNYQFDFLEKVFTEPERVSADDPVMGEAFKLVANRLLPLARGKVFSLSELTNECLLIKSYFEYFNHTDPIFTLLVNVVEKLVEHIKDEYFISVHQKRFDAILMSFGERDAEIIRQRLLHNSEDFVVISNSHHPFVKIGVHYKSNVNLIVRFLYNLKNASLNKSKQFQIKSGFIFENNVKIELGGLGFQIMDVKRIKRKEFDVVTFRDGVLFNFQCKNNFVDVTLIEKNREKFARKNSLLVRYYLKAIEKEVNREHLLIEKYGVQDVRHFVISRFPVVTKEPSIIMSKDLNRFRRPIVNKQ